MALSTTPTGPVHTSTQAARATNISWGSAGLVCKSTLTVTGSTIAIQGLVLVDQGAASADYAIGYLVDGKCPSGWACSTTCTSNTFIYTNGANSKTMMAFNWRETAASGSHSVCIWACDAAGTDPGGALEFWLEAN